MAKKGTKHKHLVTQKGIFETPEELIAFLRKCIEVDQLSQEQIARKIGCSKQQLWRYRRIFQLEGLPSGFFTKPEERIYNREAPPEPILNWD